MAKTTKKANTVNNESEADSKIIKGLSRQYIVILGALLLLFSVALALSFVSFYIYGQQDQSAVDELGLRSIEVRNWLGKFGAYLAHLFVYQGFGVASFVFVRLFFMTGSYLVLALSV